MAWAVKMHRATTAFGVYEEVYGSYKKAKHKISNNKFIVHEASQYLYLAQIHDIFGVFL